MCGAFAIFWNIVFIFFNFIWHFNEIDLIGLFCSMFKSNTAVIILSKMYLIYLEKGIESLPQTLIF